MLLLLGALLTPMASLANDGFGGLSATDLQFQQSASVRMASEDLFLSPSQVRVTYVFRNQGPTETQGEIIFPLPPISLAGLVESGFALPEERLRSDNLVDFTARVDGQRIEVGSERIAVLEPPSDQSRKASAAYDAPGQNVTGLLRELGVPRSLNVDQVRTALARLVDHCPLPLAAGLFAPGRDVTIEHSYAPPGGIFVWPAGSNPLAPYQQQLVDAYCIDAGIRKALAKRLAPPGRRRPDRKPARRSCLIMC